MKKKLTLLTAFGIIVLLILVCGIDVHAAFLISWFVTLLLCMAQGYSFRELYNGSLEYCRQSVGPMFFLLGAGAMTGVWNQCGTIPTLTWLGLAVIRPGFFLPLAFLLCCIFSFAIGTSFGAVGTMGVMFMAISESLGLPTYTSASVILLGCFCGYVFSPLSDCMNTGADLLNVERGRCCRETMYIMLPTIVLILIYTILITNSLPASVNDAEIKEIRAIIGSCIRISWPELLPMVLVLILMFRKVPSVLAMMCGAFAGLFVSILHQGQSLNSALSALWQGAVPASGNTWYDQLFTRGGILSMTNTILLFILCFSLFGLLNTCGILEETLNPIIRFTSTPFRAVLITLIVSSAATFCAASGMCAIIFTLNTLGPVYVSHGWDRAKLVAVSSLGSMMICLIIPWHSNIISPAAFMGIDAMGLASGARIVLLMIPVVIGYGLLQRKDHKI